MRWETEKLNRAVLQNLKRFKELRNTRTTLSRASSLLDLQWNLGWETMGEMYYKPLIVLKKQKYIW